MAVSIGFQGKGFGGVLLIDALRRAFNNTTTVASTAVVVDAKSEKARDFYIHYGFRLFLDHPLRLFMTMDSIEQLVAETLPT